MNERRQRILSDEDIKAIIDAVKCTDHWLNGLTVDDTIVLKDLSSWIRTAKNIVGKAVVYGFIAAVVGFSMLGLGKFGGGK